jgi:hypothetical protein
MWRLRQFLFLVWVLHGELQVLELLQLARPTVTVPKENLVFLPLANRTNACPHQHVLLAPQALAHQQHTKIVYNDAITLDF